jgi:hypothetical protein
MISQNERTGKECGVKQFENLNLAWLETVTKFLRNIHSLYLFLRCIFQYLHPTTWKECSVGE